MLLLAVHPAIAQVTRSSLSEPYSGSGVYSLHFTDAFSPVLNEASLARLEVPVAGVYGERRFLLKEMNHFKAAIAVPVNTGGVGITVDYFGGALFSASQIGIGYGRKLNDDVDIGIRINYNSIRLAGYGSGGTVTAELGTIWHITPSLHTGIHVYNPIGGKIVQEKLPFLYSWGIGYEASDKFFISSIIAKEEQQPVNVTISMQYLYTEHLAVGAGVTTGNNGYYAGVGIMWKTNRIDVISNYQPQLGFTPALQLMFDLKKKKKKEEE